MTKHQPIRRQDSLRTAPALQDSKPRSVSSTTSRPDQITHRISDLTILAAPADSSVRPHPAVQRVISKTDEPAVHRHVRERAARHGLSTGHPIIQQTLRRALANHDSVSNAWSFIDDHLDSIVEPRRAARPSAAEASASAASAQPAAASAIAGQPAATSSAPRSELRIYGQLRAGESEAQRQERYLAAKRSAIDGAKHLLGKGASGHEILEFLAAERRRIAEEQRSEDSRQFGKNRRRPASTPIIGRYGRHGVMTHATIRALQDPEVASSNLSVSKEYGLTTLTARGQVGDETLDLTSTDMHDKYFEKQGATKLHRDLAADRESVGFWGHTNPKHIGKIMGHVSNLQGQLARPNSPAEHQRNMKTIGSMSWWLSHAMPWERGSAAINEMYTSALREHFLDDHRPQKPGAVLDLEAFRRDHDEYSSSFSDFFGEPAEER